MTTIDAWTPDLAERATVTLRSLTGREDASFRSGQGEAIASLVADKARVLVVQRTGWGKSAVYFVATALSRAGGSGPTLLLSPLLALMRDQVAAAQRAGIRAMAMNSANAQEWGSVREALEADAVDVLLVSPERLTNPRFRDEILPTLLARCGIVVVDEAHCISDWGHDFRPDYRRIRSLLADLPAAHPVLATTATANSRVVDDVVEQLGAGGAEVRTIRGGLARASLRLAVIDLPDDAARLAWLVGCVPQLPGSGIIYTLTVSAAEDVAAALRDAGMDARSYTGRTEPAEREELEDALRHNKVKVLVATSALGMGFDKPDLGFVVHLGAPSSPVAYYQQVGRAGRSVDSADAVLLPTTSQRDVWRYFATATMPDEAECAAVLAALSESATPLSTQALQTHAKSSLSRLEVMLKTLAVDGAVNRVKGGWEATGEPWVYDRERYERVAQARHDEEQLMLDYAALTTCRMAFLQRCLDDPTPQPCGRCDVCAGPWLPLTVDDSQRTQAANQLGRVGTEIDPRGMWPTQMARLGVPVRGRIRPELRSEPGRAIARLTDLGVGPRLAEVLAEDGPAPQWLLASAVQVLAGWGWAERPTSVVAAPSPTRTPLVRSVAEHLAGVGRLTIAGELVDTRAEPSAGENTNSAYQLAACWGAYRVPDVVAERVRAAGGPVLLVADVATGGWELTIAGMVLRDAGAPAVLPFALARAG